MLETIDLACVRGERRLFGGLKLSLSNGSLLHVTGQNGSGKTSLLRLLCGLLSPEEGEIRWDGESIKRLGEDYRRSVTYLGHLNGIKDDLNAIENLQFAANIAGIQVGEKDAFDALRAIGIDSQAQLPTKILSQGQKRRVALARLMLVKSKLWLLDEPFAALDDTATDLLSSVISSHLGQDGIAVITSHQPLNIAAKSNQSLHLEKQ